MRYTPRQPGLYTFKDVQKCYVCMCVCVDVTSSLPFLIYLFSLSIPFIFHSSLCFFFLHLLSSLTPSFCFPFLSLSLYLLLLPFSLPPSSFLFHLSYPFSLFFFSLSSLSSPFPFSFHILNLFFFLLSSSSLFFLTYVFSIPLLSYLLPFFP